MGSRMDKYELEENSASASRTKKNAELYQKEDIEDYNKIDINSNVSVLKNDVKEIDVDKIREMLDKKYRNNNPQRKSIDIEMDEEADEPVRTSTKEYDINDIIDKAKSDQQLDYQEERLRNLKNTNYTILDNLDLHKEIQEELNEDDHASTKEKELQELINTITQLEDKNNEESEGDILNLTDNTDSKTLPPSLENSFYTGNLQVKADDFEDFKEIQKDIKANSTLTKILIVVFIIIAIVVAVFVLNNIFEWGLF